jgi:hypothetical protein
MMFSYVYANPGLKQAPNYLATTRSIRSQFLHSFVNQSLSQLLSQSLINAK